MAWKDSGDRAPEPAKVVRIEALFDTDRLVIGRLVEEDLESILGVYESNPGYIALTEGRAGAYDLQRLERDFALADTTPGRQLAGIFLKPTAEAATAEAATAEAAHEEPVGVLDWMLENPSDSRPWL